LILMVRDSEFVVVYRILLQELVTLDLFVIFLFLLCRPAVEEEEKMEK